MSKINKLITNKPVTLSEEEVTNLSKTLSAVQTAGGGGGGGRVYYGDNATISVNQVDGIISLTTDATEKLNRDIPTKVSDLTDHEDYQTTAGMSNYLTTDDAASTYQSKGDYLSANALDNISGTWENVTAKLDTTAFSTVSGNFLTAHQSLSSYYQKTETSGASELAAAFGAILNYDVTGAAGIKITTATDNGTTTFGISMTAQPVVTDTNLSGYNGIAAAPDGAKSGWWNIGLTQDMLNTINGKLDSSDFTTYTGTTAPNTYLTKTSADTLYQPTGDYVTTADVLTGTNNTLTGIKIGSTNYTIPTTDLSDYYTKTQVDSTFASASQLNSYLTTAQYQTDSATFALKTQLDDYAPISITATVNTLTAASAGWNNKVDKPTSIVDKYLVLRTDNAGNVSGWCDFQDQSYSKSEALGTFVATANIDTTTLSGDGKSVSTKLGVKTDVIATTDYVNNSFLPLSGGIVSGSVKVSAAAGNNILAVAPAATLIGASRQTSENYGVNDTAIGTTWFGVGGNGMHQGFIKYTDGGDVGALDSNSMIQLNLKPSTNNFDSVQVLQNGNSVGYLIPAVTSTTTAGLTNDGILHIILESN